MSGIRLDSAQILGLCIESIVYGAFLPLFISAIWIMNKKRSTTLFRYAMMVTVISMFCFATTHLAIDIARAFEAFVPPGTPPLTQAVKYYIDQSNPKNVAKTAVYLLQTLLGDGFVIYRLFVVWKHDWRVMVFPILLLVGSAVTGVGITYEFSVSSASRTVFTFKPWISAYLTVTLVTNVYCTSLIAGKIWRAHRNVMSSHSGHGPGQGRIVVTPANGSGFTLKNLAITIVESGAIYSASLVALLIVFYSGSNGQFPALDLINPLIGVVFTMIIVRVHLSTKMSKPPTIVSRSFHAAPPPSPRSHKFGGGGGRGGERRPSHLNIPGHGGIELRTLEVEVSTHTHEHVDSNGTRDGDWVTSTTSMGGEEVYSGRESDDDKYLKV